MRKSACVPVAFLSLLPISAFADVSGVWPIQGPIDPVCTLRQQGNAISGECRGPAAQGPIAGTVEGQTVRFTFNRTGRGGQAMAPVSFTATQNGDTLAGTMAMAGGPSGAFTARRAGADLATTKPAAPPASVPGQAMAALNQTPPRTVFDVDANGTALHQQSQMACPARVTDFPRIGTTLFDQYGFDVACSYRNGAGSVITLYLYGANGRGTLDQDFDGARSSLVGTTAGATPADGAQATPPGQGWRSAGYLLPNGGRTEIHIAPVSDWRVKLRVSYAPSDLGAVRQAVQGLADMVGKTAGAHLAACAASPRPTRQGTRDTDPGRVQTAAAASAAVAMMGMLQSPPPLRTWCAEGAFAVGQAPFLFWRNIVPASLGGAADRITSLNPIAPVLVFEVSQEAVDRAAVRVPPTAPMGAAPIYGVVVDTPDAMQVVGVFQGRPSPENVMALVLRPNVGVYASVSKQPGGGITMFKPQ